MEHIEFNKSHAYLCIQTDGDGGYDCYGCDSKEEVFSVLTKRIHEELDWLEGVGEEDGGDPEYNFFSNPEETRSFAMWVRSQDIIRNPEIIRKCYEHFFADCWGFFVITEEGQLWFGWY
jgi:hypothetical protein